MRQSDSAIYICHLSEPTSYKMSQESKQNYAIRRIPEEYTYLFALEKKNEIQEPRTLKRITSKATYDYVITKKTKNRLSIA